MQTTMRVERSEVVDGEASQLWALLSSPAAWCLWPGAAFMFAVPGAQALRCFIGPTRRGTGAVLHEISAEVPGTMVRRLALPSGRQEFNPIGQVRSARNREGVGWSQRDRPASAGNRL